MKIQWLIALLFVFGLVACGGGNTTSGGVSADGKSFRIPLAELGHGQAKYFEVEAGDTVIRFFAMQSPDGAYRVAYDACDVCYEAKKGYRQDGEFMVCNNCGQKFHSTRINEIKGGCNPAPLNHVVQSDHIVIAMGDIAQGRFYF